MRIVPTAGRPHESLSMYAKCTYVTGKASLGARKVAPLIYTIKNFDRYPIKLNRNVIYNHTYYRMPLDKLYIRVHCASCRGSRRYSAGGYYNSMKPGMWSTCPYCDTEGKVFIEASVNVIMDYINELSLDDYAKVLSKLGQKKSEI